MSVLPVGFGSALGGYQIERSLRFDGSAYLNRTPASATNQKTWTWSAWVKRSVFGATKVLFDARASGSNPVHAFYFTSSDQLGVFIRNASATVIGSYNTSAVFRDPSAWYQITYKFDSTQATATNRVEIYVNGVLQAITASTTISQNADAFINSAISHGIGAEGVTPTDEFDGYMTEVNFVDSPVLVGSTTNASTTVTLTTGTTTNIGIGWSVGGTNIPSGATVSSITNSTQFVISSAATATGSSISIGVAPPVSAFGETDSNTGVWKPKAYSGTYGTNGFYLKFADNSGTTSTTLGKDSSGNGNNWTPNGFSVTAGTGNDSLVDTPTAYGTDTGVGGEVRGNYATFNSLFGTSTLSNGNLQIVGPVGDALRASTLGLTSGKWYAEITIASALSASASLGVAIYNQAALPTVNGTASRGYYYNGQKYSNGTLANYGNSFTNGDVIGIAIDLDNGKLWFSKNGTWQASGDPVAGTNAAYTDLGTTSTWFITVQTGGATGSATCHANFGQRPFEKWNGSAYVANTAPSGFKALCTQNLPTPTIGATSTTQANDYMDVTLYTGNATARSITNSGSMQPDFVWNKLRSGANSHRLFDAVRGVEKALYSNLTNIEATETGTLTAFNSNGFSLGTNNETNTNGSTYVAWQWKANGAGSTNTAGTITSTVSANNDSGFSIVTGTLGAAGVQNTVGHGCKVGGVATAPSMILFKTRSGATYNWTVFHVSISTDTTKYLRLNDTSGTLTYSTTWGAALPTSTVFGVTGDGCGSPSNPFVAYCFAPVAGYSAFGSYTGNGSTDGPFVYTGFRPRFVLLKSSSLAGSFWNIVDTARNSYNVINTQLYPNSSSAEGTVSVVDTLSNGFKIRTTNTDFNSNTNTYIYAAFAESPFKYALAR